jgi:hypothetical protein
MMLQTSRKSITVAKKTVRKPRVGKQMKEIQQAIMDCILTESEKAKEECFVNTSDDPTARGLSYGVTKDIIEKHKKGKSMA